MDQQGIGLVGVSAGKEWFIPNGYTEYAQYRPQHGHVDREKGVKREGMVTRTGNSRGEQKKALEGDEQEDGVPVKSWGHRWIPPPLEPDRGQT